MDAYAKSLSIAIPIFVLLMIIEALYDWKTGRRQVRALDTISSLSSGVTNLIKDSLGLIIIIVSYPFLVEHLSLFEIKATWLVYLLGFIAIDFAGYWNHRLSHSINFFWNRHRVHHSSEEFNLPCALRQTISSIFGTTVLFLIPAATLGIPPEVINFIAPIHLFMQFWYHTRYIGKLGILEYIIITPSQHRVHHAINPEYIDKNLGQIFSVWDRIFGTFQEELDDVPPVYGVTMPARTWNPVKINFQHLFLLFRDAWYAKNPLDKLRVFYKPTGWRPADVAARFPVRKIDDVYHFEKYDTPATPALIAWSWFQYAMVMFLAMYLLFNFKSIGSPGVFLYALVLFVCVYGYTEVMDRNKNAVWVEMLRAVLGLALLLKTGDWFGLESVIPGATIFLAAYFLTAPPGAWFFTQKESYQPQVER
ncbi:MAG: sterol desaturase family protein [Bacteroidetes bacterium]|nr:MAG: sterol desaturase family protein [Bacteroidota bacterium]